MQNTTLEQDPPVSPRAPALALSAALLGISLHLTDGLYSPTGLGVLTLSLILCIAAVLTPYAAIATLKSAPTRRITPRTFHLFLTTLVAIQLFSMLFVVAGATEATVPKVPQRPFQMGVAIATGGLAMLAASSNRRGMWIGFLIMAASFAGTGIWKIRSAPSPHFDVFVFHRDAAQALAHGINPYTITFPNIYDRDTYVYGPGVVQGDRLLFGYPYPPLVLLCTAAAQLTLGDSRYAMLLSMLATAVMIALIRRDRVGMLAAMLLLFTPRAFYVLELAWTEPISVMLLTATVLCASRTIKQMSRFSITPGEGNGSSVRGLVMPAVLGLLLASKQYLPATILLLPILHSGSHRWKKLLIDILIAGAVAAIVTLPLALWDFRAFWESTLTLQLRQPYRPDALSYLAWWGYGRAGWTGPFWLAFVALLAAAGLCLWRLPRGISGFVMAFALTYFAFFAFNKQAFANYYYLVLGALAVASALTPSYFRAPAPQSPPN
jgi:hypothetical protein